MQQAKLERSMFGFNFLRCKLGGTVLSCSVAQITEPPKDCTTYTNDMNCKGGMFVHRLLMTRIIEKYVSYSTDIGNSKTSFAFFQKHAKITSWTQENRKPMFGRKSESNCLTCKAYTKSNNAIIDYDRTAAGKGCNMMKKVHTKNKPQKNIIHPCSSFIPKNMVYILWVARGYINGLESPSLIVKIPLNPIKSPLNLMKSH